MKKIRTEHSGAIEYPSNVSTEITSIISVKMNPGRIVHVCNIHTWEVELEGS